MGFIKNYFRSLYDFKVYKELKESSGLKAFLYVVIIAAVLGVVVAVPVYFNSRSSITVVENNVNKIPEFSIKNNNLDLKKDGPVIIKEDGMVLIFDGSSDNNEEYTKADNAILWGKTCRKKRLKGKEAGIAKYADSKGITLDKNYVIEEAKSYKFVPIKIILQNIVISYMITLMTSLIMMLFDKRKENPMSFGEIFKISSFAVTAPIILFSCLCAIGVGNIPIASWVLVIIQALYVRKAMKVIRGENDNKVVGTKKILNKK